MSSRHQPGGPSQRAALLVPGCKTADKQEDVEAGAAPLATVTDLAEQTEALRQQVAAARNKLGLLRQSFAAKIDEASKLN